MVRGAPSGVGRLTGPLLMSLHAVDWPDDVHTLLEGLDEDELVTLVWTNAELKATAGAIRAWLELGDLEHAEGRYAD